LDFETAPEVHLIGLDDAAIGIFQHPDHTGEHGRGNL
jgi:hypothetical protein